MSTPNLANANNGDPIQVVLSRLTNVKITGDGKWRACCPVHGDEHPSLDVKRGEDGRVLLICRSRRCPPNAICAAIGLTEANLFVQPPERSRGVKMKSKGKVFPTIEVLAKTLGPRCGEHWIYPDANGTPVMATVRINPAEPGAKKEYPILRPCSGGWQFGAPSGLRPLYHLDEIDAAKKNGIRRIYVVEGEKCADALRERGFFATTWSGGANAVEKTDFSPLAGIDEIIILPDHDMPGERAAQQVAGIFLKQNPAANVKIVALPELPEAGDIVNYIEARPGLRNEDLQRTIDQLIAKTAPVTQSEAMGFAAEDPYGSFGSSQIDESEGIWPDPEPLPDDRPAVAPFDYSMLPMRFEPWIRDVAERAQCPPDFSAVAAMVSLATVVGRKIAIRPKRHDSWTVVPNLWGAIVAPVGLLKTPMLEEGTRALRRLEVRAKKEYEEDVMRENAMMMVGEARVKVAKKDIEKALKEGGDAQAIAESALLEKKSAPTRRRYLLNDPTVEKLGEILNENPNGVLVFRDELMGFLKSLEREGHESARAFYLEAWNGNGRFTYDRIGRGTIDIESTTVSILGGIQPSVMDNYLRLSTRANGEDGFIQRFQLMVCPDIPDDFHLVDRYPNTTAKNVAYAVFEELDELKVDELSVDRDEDDPPFLRFDSLAQERFDQWFTLLELKLRSHELHPVMEAHLSKFRSLIPTLALLIHLADGGRGRVGIEALEKAIRWGEYLESHANRIYAVAIHPDLASARVLASKIESGELSDGFALKDVYRPGWSGLGDRERAVAAVDVLTDYGWLKSTREETAGAPKVRYWVNPKILNSPGNGAAKTAKSPESDLLAVKAVRDPEQRGNSDTGFCAEWGSV